MAINDVADQHFTYEARLASFQTAQQLSKRRTSNASSKAPKSMKWPHKFLPPEELAKAGFFYYPLQVNPDNVACFLCHKSLDGWEKGDDPLVEHLRHSPDCGWAIVATIESQDGVLNQEYPASTRMIDARKATFADKWPHESKKGWKCKTKQMVDAGWKYTPSPEYDDMATCTYCSLALDGWEPGDKPLDEHFKRSPECPFFVLVNDLKQSPAGKKARAKKDRTSKASRLSTQSTFTAASEVPSLSDLPVEDEDTAITTTTTASQGVRKIGKGKKGGASKSKKTKSKKDESVEEGPAAPEPEDDDFEVKVDVTPKATRGKKRKSEDVQDSILNTVETERQAPKRRVTRTRGSIAIDQSILGGDESTVIPEDHPKQAASSSRKRGRVSTAKSSRKASSASLASLGAAIPKDDEIDQALEADLEGRLTDDDDEIGASKTPIRKAGRPSTITKADHALFTAQPMDLDEAAIEAELDAMEMDSKRLPKAKAGRNKQPRKPSAKQQTAARKAAEAEAEAQRVIEEEASQQIASELEHSMQHSSPVAQPKRQRASRQPSRQRVKRGTRASEISTNECTSLTDDFQDASADQNDDSGNETDASMASQSTIVRGGSSRRGSTVRKGKGGKKAASRNIEEIVHKPHCQNMHQDTVKAAAVQRPKSQEVHQENTNLADESLAVSEPPVPERTTSKSKSGKPKGRPAKATPVVEPPKSDSALENQPKAMAVFSTSDAVIKAVAQRARSPTPPPKERTPSQSPQSSDAENHPPSSKPSASVKPPAGKTKRVALAVSTPTLSPSKRNIIAGLQSTQPWTAVDLEGIFVKSPGGENAAGKTGLLDVAMVNARNGDLTSPEKRMTVEEWIKYNAQLAEEKLRNECERMVGIFESEGGRAMRSLEGIECLE